ncbi:uncharacterized protein LOC115983803 [Quercus lobata]|uniref:uncharacterized protein LOC115983803 n=1 Tax=Quercus lobata TaxID=97700 RepID=UPI0012481C04|nr:uncharacterized protein LOC115983803 [Quercus lobata]
MVRTSKKKQFLQNLSQIQFVNTPRGGLNLATTIAGISLFSGSLCEHEAANMNIGGKELNQLASLTTSEQIKETTNLVQNLDPIQNFLALILCNKS